MVNKSGRWWKAEQKQRHTAIIKVKALKSSLKKRKNKRCERELIKAKETEIREALAIERIKKQEQKKEQEERRKLNEKKGEVVQVICNTKKLMRTKNKKNIRNIETRDINSI